MHRWGDFGAISAQGSRPCQHSSSNGEHCSAVEVASFAGAICIAYFGITRPGEVLRATRKDLVLAEDLLLPPSSTAYLRIENAKSRRRGKHRVQHASVVNADVTGFLSKVFGGLSYDELLYPISGSSFRRRWDRICERLLIGKEKSSHQGLFVVEVHSKNTELEQISKGSFGGCVSDIWLRWSTMFKKLQEKHLWQSSPLKLEEGSAYFLNFFYLLLLAISIRLRPPLWHTSGGISRC